MHLREAYLVQLQTEVTVWIDQEHLSKNIFNLHVNVAQIVTMHRQFQSTVTPLFKALNAVYCVYLLSLFLSFKLIYLPLAYMATAY